MIAGVDPRGQVDRASALECCRSAFDRGARVERRVIRRIDRFGGLRLHDRGVHALDRLVAKIRALRNDVNSSGTPAAGQHADVERL